MFNSLNDKAEKKAQQHLQAFTGGVNTNARKQRANYSISPTENFYA